MKINPFKRAICFMLVLLFVVGVIVVPVSAQTQNQADTRLEDMQKYLDSESYKNYSASYQAAGKGPGQGTHQATFAPDMSVDTAFVINSEDMWKENNFDGTYVNKVPERDANGKIVTVEKKDADGKVKHETVYKDAVNYDKSGTPVKSADNYKPNAVYAPATGKTTFTVENVPEGMYYIVIEYYTVAKTVNSPERKLFIDDKMPFTEASSLSMTKIWGYDYVYTTDEKGNKHPMFDQDVNGNDLTPAIAEVSKWMTYICSDSNGYSNEYYEFYFTPGDHTITLDSIREALIIGSVALVPVGDAKYSVPTYESYIQTLKDKYGTIPNGTFSEDNIIQAEKPDYVSDSSVAMTNNKNSCITEPTSPKSDLYNVIGANSYKSVGQWAAYDFTVPATGMYTISMRYLQTVLDGMFISRAVKLTSNNDPDATFRYGLADGTPTVPFKEAYSARFNYDKEWKIATVSDGESHKQVNGETSNDFEFFFEKDVTYTIYFEVSLGALAAQLQRVEEGLTALNNCYLQILRLTGSNPDKNAEYDFDRRIPETIYELNYWAVELNNIRNEFAKACGVDTAAHLATMDNITRQIAKMGNDPSGDEIAGGLAELKTNLGTLGTWISDSKASTLIVDFFAVQPVDTDSKKIGKENANVFQTIWYEIRAFWYSWWTDYDMMGVTNANLKDSNPLDVWLATGRDQSKVIRNMIDADFADYCGASVNPDAEIPVALKLVTGGTLLPSILAGKGPAVYMGLDAGSIMNFAIRNAILPLNEDNSAEDTGTVAVPLEGREGFYDIVPEDYATANPDDIIFHKAAMDAIKLPDMTADANGKKNDWNYYGLPMTMSFAMMFYRMDFLVEQKAGVPETWDDLLALLPILNENNMEIGMNYVLALDFFLYQNGGNMWRYTDNPEYAGAQIGLDTDEGLSAFEFCTSLYTDYSFPVYFDAANRFRTGEMPIVIQDYVGTYNQLIVFATEIEGLWAFSQIPGTTHVDREGNKTVDHTSMASVTAAVITSNGKSRKAESWEFVKWCTSADYISDYSNRIVAILGPSAKYAGANMKALENMSWTTDEMKAIKEQMDHLDTIVNFPGSYIIARYTNFAFLAAVNDGQDSVEAIREYITAINTEITRKREEFEMKTLAPGETPPEVTQTPAT